MAEFEDLSGNASARPGVVVDYAPRAVKVVTRSQVLVRQAICYAAIAGITVFVICGAGGSFVNDALPTICGPFGAILVDRARGRTQDIGADMAAGFVLAAPMVIVVAFAMSIPHVRALRIVSYVTIFLWFVAGVVMVTLAGARGCC